MSSKSSVYHIKFQVVDLEPENCHIVVKAKIDGHPLNIVLDTGASHSCFDLSFIQNLKPDINMEDNDGLNVGVGASDFESKLSTIHNLKLGRFLLPDYDVVLLDMSNINNAYEAMKKPLVHGIIGSDFFVRYRAVIDYDQKTLFITKPAGERVN